ncbi:hypothetical protein CVD25_17915 [Bacillus canaveralius]|uniref:CamS family sex pheromone protein n=1 Tax=Bacillus canaveralius TaxID=1403243 RepID=A0A2N5GST3_9BACI|nr:hypothetical protein [Bacillus canaveralius]PLR86823.1 hypothetical protein CU635_00590 [Bacillus canaveralius]PLR92716.1 hypothetical protein CVD25_17915 [Bacillus canaveralius]RSK53670.1 hypothetical protein EJA13_07625 [Bacillus canaveralius]
MKKIVILWVCICSFVLSACFPTGEQKDSSRSVSVGTASGSTPKFMEMELEENLKINADITGVESKKLKNYSISLKNLDENQILKTFLKDKTIVENREVKNDLFPDYKDKFFGFSDGSYLTMQLGSIRYDDSFYSEREYENVISGSTYFMRNDLKDVFNETTLEGLDKNEAVEKVRNAVKDLGIFQTGNPEVITLDFKTLESEWEDYETKDGSQPRKFEKDDEAYAVIFPVVLDKTNITNKGYSNADNQMEVVGSRIMGVVGKDGLIFLTVQGIYEIGETLKDNISPISLETALEKVKNKYKDVLIKDPILISRIALEYVPTVSTTEGINYKLIPAWVFSGKQDLTIDDKKGGSFKMSADFSILINAETGEELRSGGER